jgi:hypothetical protein
MVLVGTTPLCKGVRSDYMAIQGLVMDQSSFYRGAASFDR